MRHWSQLGIRNWRAKPGRTAGALGAIALGVGVIIWVTCAYESVRLALEDQVWFWTGRSHLSVESSSGPEGTIEQSFTRQVAGLPNVAHVTQQLRYRALMTVATLTTAPADAQAKEIQAIGIDPATEKYFRQYDESRISGRTLRPGETGSALIEYGLADEFGLKPGDKIVLVEKRPDLQDAVARRTAEFTLVGLVEHRRVAKQQLPIVITTLEQVQKLAGYDEEPRKISKIDIILNDSSIKALKTSEFVLRKLAQSYGHMVTSAEAKLQQVRAAEQQTGFVLLILSTVALFTAFFVILSTLSMGMIERIGLLGMLRCLGTTRLQIALLVLAEAVPLGLTGILLGVPVGLGLARLSVWLVPDYIGQFAINRMGLVLALAGGALTTMIGSLLPMVQAIRISPLDASKPQSRPPMVVFVWLAAAAGVALIAGHSFLIHDSTPNQWFEPVRGPIRAVSAVVLLYAGYALITPALVRVVGQAAVRLAAVALRLRVKLLSDQVGRATWRSSAICCGLMVGLSLIVSLVVHSKSLAGGWDFPKDFCEAFVHVAPPVPRDGADTARRMPGIASSAIINVSTQCKVVSRKALLTWNMRFVSGEPDEFFNIARLGFVAGKKDEAILKLKKGGYILVTPEFTRSQNAGYGDKVSVILAGDPNRGGLFEIAGVVSSPAVDIAANYFNAGGMLASQSAYAVLGTQDDLRRMLRVRDEVSMFLINFDLPDTPPPDAFRADQPPSTADPQPFAALVQSWRAAMPERAAELDAIMKQLEPVPAGPTRPAWSAMPMLYMFRTAVAVELVPQWSRLTPAERWRAFREELVLRLIPSRARAADEQHKSVRALKAQIDRDLNRATLLFTAIPMVALIVAALGVGNLMTANVTSRTRQIAMLRAIGATKWQITRLIIGEAVVLGALGSVLGLALGLHAAFGMNAITHSVWGFAPKWTIPWTWVGTGIAFTMSVCLIAGIIPARYASRNNIIDALQAT